ncbi:MULTISPECIES: DUF4296 domain-containing protein [unclassified Imperialibacter]|uniref:DUF4296 domain-containing protein n=1 Tax=unclassified Imperialibacter TaxID=2629706 RepID=UPI0012528086|nr:MULTISPECIES: DUF4296 domain-containing protein [unclassified Imperialibacter]CAD5251832.1 putative Lipoprotein [Imperialibacter sp. 89]CAD5265328.1 putative Lipoprotein [Imperialibacter sp. 75]VVT03117.1 putative Lipoprotein [Imperialibacter sp. EC-SDR9]
MKNVFWSLGGLFFISLFGCSNKEEIPVGVVEPQRMISILTDIHQLETEVASLKLTYDSSTALYKQQQQLLFDKHNVSDSVYTHSFEYYLEHVEMLDKIYAAVVDSLSVRRNMGPRKEPEESGESL